MTKLRTLGQLRHRSVAMMLGALFVFYFKCGVDIHGYIYKIILNLLFRIIFNTF